MTLHRGKIAKNPEILSVRALTREDLALVLEKRTGEDGRPIHGAAARFRDSHHRVARLFALGLRIHEVVERSGYSYQRVYQLSTDPAFQELVAKNRDKVDEKYLEHADEQAADAISNMRKAERMIGDRLDRAEEEDIDIPLKTLVDISADRMDRFGYGKKQTNVNLNVDFASKLENAISRSGKAKVIEAAVLPGSGPQSPAGAETPSRSLLVEPPTVKSSGMPLRRRA